MIIDLTNKGNLPVDLIKLLNKIADNTRSDYNALIEKLSIINTKNSFWWFSEIASRNVFATDLFQNLCYLELVAVIIKKQILISEIITSSTALAKVLKKKYQNIKITVVANIGFSEVLRPVYFYLMNCLRLFRQYTAALLTKKTKNLPLNITLIDTFIFNHSFNGKIFKDRYLNYFCDTMEKDFFSNVYFTPTYIGINNYFKTYKQIRNSKQNFILKEDFLNPFDIIGALFYPIKLYQLKLLNISYKNFDISSLLYSARYQNLNSFGTIEAILKYKFAKRLSKKKVSIRMVIDWFENQSIDKGFNLGFRTYYPDIIHKGYQVVLGQKNYLCFYPTKHENESKVLPQIIYTSGRRNIESLKEFSPDLNIGIAPSFRYEHLWKERRFSPDISYFSILIVLPGLLEDATSVIRLLNIVVNSFTQNIRFFVKLHPSVKLEEVKNKSTGKWSSKFKVIEGDFSEAIEKSNLVISANSSSCLEVIAKGIPIIIIGSQSGLTHNPIPESIKSDIWSLCYTSKELLDAINFYKNQTLEKRKEYNKIGKQIREDYFEPVTKEGVRKFLQLEE